MPSGDTLTTLPELKVILKSLELARVSGASIYVELGVKRAGTSKRIRLFLERTKVRGRFFGVDIDPKARGEFSRRMGKPRADGRLSWRFLHATSQEALELVVGPVAWVFVDACHCFECATEDIEAWGSRLAPGGVLVVHDTTPRRRHYTKPFQHGGTRRFGVWEAVDKSEREGWLSRHARKVIDLDDQNGVRVYVREDQDETGPGESGGPEGSDNGAVGKRESREEDSSGGGGSDGCADPASGGDPGLPAPDREESRDHPEAQGLNACPS